MNGKRILGIIFLFVLTAAPIYAQQVINPLRVVRQLLPQQQARRQQIRQQPMPVMPQSQQAPAVKSKPAIQPEPESVSWTDDTDFLKQFTEACQKAADQFSDADSASKTAQLRETLKNETKSLLYMLNRNPDRQNAANWVKYLQLEEIQRMLRAEEDDPALLAEVQERFAGGNEGLNAPYFTKYRDVLESYAASKQTVSNDQNRQTFAETKDFVISDVQDLLEQGDAEQAEALADLMLYLQEMQPDSEPLKTAQTLLSRRFAVPNAQLSVSRRTVFSDQAIPFTEPTTINENIRGTATQGKGTVTGMIRPVFVENPDRAEIQIQIDALLNSNNVGYNQGVTVQSTSSTHLIGKKSIYLTDKVFTDPAIVTGSIDAKITGINTGRGAVGSRVANDRISQEYPYSKAESKKRAELRMAERLNDSIDGALTDNGLEKILNLLRKNECPPRETVSSTTEDRLTWKSLFGKTTQIGPAQNDATEMNHDLVLKLHESGPCNIAYAVLAGRRISDKEFGQWLDSLKPNADEEAADAEQAEESPFYMTFSTISPLLVRYNENKIRVTARIEQFEQDGKEFPGLAIEIVFALEKQENRFCFKRESLDVWPIELERTDSIPARFQAVRTQVLKRLDEGIKAEYALESISIKELSMKQDEERKIRGRLVPAQVLMQNGWFLFGADFVPGAEKTSDASKPVSQKRLQNKNVVSKTQNRNTGRSRHQKVAYAGPMPGKLIPIDQKPVILRSAASMPKDAGR